MFAKIYYFTDIIVYPRLMLQLLGFIKLVPVFPQVGRRGFLAGVRLSFSNGTLDNLEALLEVVLVGRKGGTD